jgi:aarF domain-containing kinase
MPCAKAPVLFRALRGGRPLSATVEGATREETMPADAGATTGKPLPRAEAPAGQAGGAAPSGASFLDLLAALGGGGGAAAQQPQQQPSCRENTANFGVGMGRSMRAMAVFNEVKADYEKSLANVTDAKQRAQVLQQLHARSAPKALKLARENGGLYNKAAQFIASLQAGAGDRGIPKEYVDVLSVLTDKAPGKPFAEMAPVLAEEFGKPHTEIFKWIDETPLAAASLAQVHRAELHNGTRVAVKIIYPSLRKEMASDFAVLRTFGASIRPAGLDLTWLLADFEASLAKELDFEQEASNAEQSARILAHLPAVKIPSVVREYTRKSVLTMELEDSLIRISDADKLRAAGLDPMRVGALVADTFAEMALCHGYVHGDPHAGNIYVRAVKGQGNQGSLLDTLVRGRLGVDGDAGNNSGHENRAAGQGDGVGVELVMLDHGCVHTLEEEARERLCKLVLACVERRSADLQVCCHVVCVFEYTYVCV